MNDHDDQIRRIKQVGLTYGPITSDPTAPKFSPLTEDEQRTFDFLRSATLGVPGAGHPQLFRVQHDGVDRALIAVVWQQGGELVVTPIALLITDTEHAALATPEVP